MLLSHFLTANDKIGPCLSDLLRGFQIYDFNLGQLVGFGSCSMHHALWISPQRQSEVRYIQIFASGRPVRWLRAEFPIRRE